MAQLYNTETTYFSHFANTYLMSSTKKFRICVLCLPDRTQNQVMQIKLS